MAHLNIERCRQMLAQEIDEAKRQMTTRLLTEEEVKLTGAPSINKKRPA